MKAKSIRITAIIFSIIVCFACRQAIDDPNQSASLLISPFETMKITVIKPKLGSVLMIGDVVEINWVASSAERITIQLYRKQLKFQSTIARDIENTGKFNWQIHDDIPTSNHYFLKVINENNPAVFAFSGRFRIQK